MRRRPFAFAFVLAFALLLGAGLALASFAALRQPLSLGDYHSIWGLKARALYRSGELASILRVDPSGEFSHPGYPLLWPLLLSGMARALGRYDELLLALLRPLLLAAAAAFAYRATRAPRPFRLGAAAGLVLLPYFQSPAYAGYAEGLLLVFVLAALGELPRLDEGLAPRLRLGLFLALAAATKNEGALLAAVAGLLLLAAKRGRAGSWALGAPLLLAVGPWALWQAAHGAPHALADHAISAFDPARAARAAAVLLEVGIAPNAGWIAGVALVLALSPAVARRRRGVLAAAALYSGALLASFAFSVPEPAWLVTWTWDRLALVPVALLLPVLAECGAAACAGGSPAREGEELRTGSEGQALRSDRRPGVPGAYRLRRIAATESIGPTSATLSARRRQRRDQYRGSATRPVREENQLSGEIPFRS